MYTRTSQVAQRQGSTHQCRSLRRHGFHLWAGKIPWRRKWQPTPVFLRENSMDRRAWRTTGHGVTEKSDTTKQLSMQVYTYTYIRG